jgi:anti-anti-sigma factor
VGARWWIAEPVDGSVRVDVAGDLDFSVEEELVAAVGAVAPGTPVVLDLGRVEFLDSGGVRALMRIHRDAGGDVTLAHVPTGVARVLRIAGVDALFAGDGAEPTSGPG